MTQCDWKGHIKAKVFCYIKCKTVKLDIKRTLCHTIPLGVGKEDRDTLKGSVEHSVALLLSITVIVSIDQSN